MDLKSFCCLLTPDPHTTDEGMESSSQKGRWIEVFVFLMLLALITSVILFGKSLIDKLLVVFFVVVLLLILLKRVKNYFAQSETSQKEKYFVYFGAFAVLLSMVVFSLWVGYCEYADMYGCQYPTYILCGEVVLVFFLVVFLFKRKE
ncbi:MAG: hypothetical protein HXS48_08185 [Theionarchaea archaeon]|nr:hypothetical protein [Theionarchaea archaeon]